MKAASLEPSGPLPIAKPMDRLEEAGAIAGYEADVEECRTGSLLEISNQGGTQNVTRCIPCKKPTSTVEKPMRGKGASCSFRTV